MTQDDPFGPPQHERGLGDVREPLASRVISVLCERQNSTAMGARQMAVEYLVRATTGTGAFDPALVMETLRGYRLTVDAIIDLYIPQTAARLGELWLSSDIDFACVTVGALRLQSLLSEAAVDLPPKSTGDHAAPSALVVVPEGEHHFLGAMVVAAQLRRLGCDVSQSICEPRAQILSRIEHSPPDMVLMSCARLRGLESIERTAKTIQTTVENPPVLAIGGALQGKTSDIRKKTGVDLVTNSAKEVVGFCVKRGKALGLK